MTVLRLLDFENQQRGFIDLTALPMPVLGGKCWVMDKKGQFVLERGPGTLRTIACSGAGSGSLLVIDGVPGESGEPEGSWRQLFKANPVVMGSWMLDAGFSCGLTIRHYGGQDSTPSIASIVWVPYRARK